MRYIALLRGINVGGKNKLSMAELKKEFLALGFTQVSTYINSGNILFESPSEDPLALAGQITEMIRTRFALDVATAVYSKDAYKDALAHAPQWWNQSEQAKHNGIFVIPPTSPNYVLEQVGQAKPEYEQVALWGPLIYWTAPLKTFSRTRWSKVAATKAYAHITIRNANTVLKLMELLEKS